MSTQNARGLQVPDRRSGSLARDHQYGLIFESFLALHHWRNRHGLPDASCSSITPEAAAGQPVHDETAPHPEVITA